MSVVALQELLDSMKIHAMVNDCENNGIVSKYTITLLPGARVKKIENITNEIALTVKSLGKPLIRVIPHLGIVEIECLTNANISVGLNHFQPDDSKTLPLYLGRSYDGKNVVEDLSLLPHLLIAGTTGSGKSCLLHSIVCGLLKNSHPTKLVLIDPKQVEFDVYNNSRHLACPVITSPEGALSALEEVIGEMEDRYKLISKSKKRNIKEYNESSHNKIPYLVVIIDEFADLMSQFKKQFQQKITIIAQKARACGIHMIIATQRPSTDVITGTIKANFPSRISCKVASGIDSRVVLDCNGAEKLLGRGDAFIKSDKYDMVRFKATYLNDTEISDLVGIDKKTKWECFVDRLFG